jgi:putative FmdB family regulatory protein
MPTYDYVCEACQHEFELFQSIKDEAKKKCPECGKRRLRRLIGPGAAIVFRGSGFYTTDYRSESYKKAAAADKAGGKPAESKGKDKPSETAKKKDKAKD